MLNACAAPEILNELTETQRRARRKRKGKQKKLAERQPSYSLLQGGGLRGDLHAYLLCTDAVKLLSLSQDRDPPERLPLSM